MGVKELFALSSPWFFGLVPRSPTPRYEAGWRLVLDNTTGYAAKWGLRTLALDARAACTSWDQGNGSSWNPGSPVDPRQTCSCYNATYGECSWDGPSWPYESARLLSAMANLLQPGEQYTDAQRAAAGVTAADFQALLTQYATAMTHGHVAGARVPPYVGENIHPDLGYWVARQDMFLGWTVGTHPTSAEDPPPPTGGGPLPELPLRERSVDYFHSTFIDNVLGGLFGLRGQTNATTLVVSPLVDASRLQHFAVDNLRYHGREVAVSWDPAGSRYPKLPCKGLCVFVDGKLAAKSPGLSPPLVVLLPE
eukprot:SAG22_NODE_1795_length_3553_cov_5.156051_2_plen_308_part_00